MKAIIIDDSDDARAYLKDMLQQHFSEIDITGEAANVPDGVLLINKFQPDIVFLDVEMPQYDGFKLFEFIQNPHFQTIFTTSHAQFALKAFEFSAIDYLLKPYGVDALARAINKAKVFGNKFLSERYEALKTNMEQPEIRKIALPFSTGLLFIHPSEIIYLQSDRSYTNFFLTESRTVLVSKKMKEYEILLFNSTFFFRPHRSYIININRVKEYQRSEGGYIIMENMANIPLSKEQKGDFLAQFKIA